MPQTHTYAFRGSAISPHSAAESQLVHEVAAGSSDALAALYRLHAAPTASSGTTNDELGGGCGGCRARSLCRAARVDPQVPRAWKSSRLAQARSRPPRAHASSRHEPAARSRTL